MGPWLWGVASVVLAAGAADGPRSAWTWSPPPGFEPAQNASGEFLARTGDGVLLVASNGVSLGAGRLTLVGARRARGEGEDPLPGKVNYFLGPDPKRWRAGLPTFARVRYRRVYTGVDFVLHWSGRHLELDFDLAPGASPEAIRLQFDGAESLAVDACGDLHARFGDKDWVLRRPTARPDVGADYVVEEKGVVAIRLGAHDRSKPLLVDPVMAYSSDFGAGNAIYATALAVDAAGSATVCGFTTSTFPTTAGAFATSSAGGQEAFVAKLAAGGATLVYATYLGGSGNDACRGLGASPGGVFVVGDTDSPDFPTTPGAPQRALSGGQDAFIAELDGSGSALVTATYLGGTQDDSARAVAVDASGAAVVAGVTASSDLPATPGAFQTAADGGSDAFVFAWPPDAGTWRYGTYLGGAGDDSAAAVAVDSAGAAYVAGSTSSANFPTTPGALRTTHPAAFSTGFVTKLDATGAALAYSTYLGGSTTTAANGLAVDATGRAFVVGQTLASDFPVTAGAAIGVAPGGGDGFLAIVDATGALLDGATYVGGSGLDVVTGVALDAAGAPYVVGWTDSLDFPVTAGVFAATNAGGRDAFVAKIRSDATAFLYATYFGGELDDLGEAIAVNAAGNAYVAGDTTSVMVFPTTAGAWQPYSIGGEAGFVAQLDPLGATLTYATYLDGANVSGGQALAVDPAGRAVVVGSTYALDFPTTRGAAQPAFAGGLGDAVVSVLNPQGTALAYSTYLGGSQADEATSVAVGEDGTLYVAGFTSSPDFPVTAGAAQSTYGGAQDGFVVAFSADGGRLVYGTYLGGSAEDAVSALAVSAAGQVVVAGYTYSTDLKATAGAVQSSNDGGSDALVASLNPSGSAWTYVTYLGGALADGAEAVALLPSGDALVGGLTQSADFPTTPGAFQAAYGGGGDGFIARVNATGTSLVFSTYLGGMSDDGVYALAAGDGGVALAAGATASSDFPIRGAAFQKTLAGGHDAFVVAFDVGTGTPSAGTFLGGSGEDVARGVGFGPAGEAYLAGSTVSPDFPVTRRALQPALNGSQNGFVAVVGAGAASLAYSSFLGGAGQDTLNALVVGPDASVFVAGQSGSTNFPVTAGAFTTPLTGIDRNVFVTQFQSLVTDAGHDAGGASDAGAEDAGPAPDAGGVGPKSPGCGCGAPGDPWLGLAALALLMSLIRASGARAVRR